MYIVILEVAYTVIDLLLVNENDSKVSTTASVYPVRVLYTVLIQSCIEGLVLVLDSNVVVKVKIVPFY